MRKWIILVALVLVAGGAVGFHLWGSADSGYELSRVTVETKPLTMTVETSGTVEPLFTVEVGCEVSGKIVEMAVDNDQPVTKGQVIARIDPELPKAENAQSEADFLKAQSALADAKLSRDEQLVNLPVRTKQALGQKQEAQAALVDAEFNWKRIEELHKNENAPEAEWVQATYQWKRAQANLTIAEATYQQAVNNEKVLIDRADQLIAQAEAALKLAQAHLDFTRTRVDRCIIRSPIEGVVLRRHMDVGQTVISAFQTPVLFLLAPSLKTMRVNAKVGESDISHVEVGQKARFTIEAKRSQTFDGTILQKRSQPDIINNVVTYTVIFEVANPEGILLPGLSVNVVIECIAKPSVPQVANAALRFKPPVSADERQAAIARARHAPRPTSDAAGRPAVYCSESFVWRFEEAGRRWEAVPLWIGITDNVNTEILIGAQVGEQFVKKFTDKSQGSFSLKDALKLASPGNRSL